MSIWGMYAASNKRLKARRIKAEEEYNVRKLGEAKEKLETALER